MGVDCPQCHRGGHRLFSVGDLNRKVSARKFDYYRCGNCGLIFLAPIPSDLAAYYPDTYHEIPRSIEDLKSATEHEIFKVETIKAYSDGRRLLEIGPSYGRFAFLAKSAGFDVHALEMDRACCEFLNDVVGIRAIHTTDVLESVRQSGSYDVIALWHAVEHLPDPWTLLDVLPSKLNAGGILAIASPNPQSLQFRLFGKFWVHVDAPRHVELIPADVLTRRLVQNGLNRVHFTTSDQGARDCNGLGWYMSPMHIFGRGPFGKLVRIISVRLARVVGFVEKFPGAGAAYTAVFKKA